MESGETSRDLLDNVSISDVNNSQYMIQRMAVDNNQLLNTELLQHNGLVVDLGAGDFIPVNYTSEDLLSQDLTEEDRNLAAALVAVQLSQQQKQQQLQQDSSVIINSALPSLVNNGLGTSKVGLSEQQLILTDKAAAALNGSYLQIVGHDGIYVDKQTLPKLIDSRFTAQGAFEQKANLKLSKRGDDESDAVNTHRDSDGENKCDNRTSKKSLPHKKRISRKLKKTCPTSRKVIHKCNQCEQTFNTNEEYTQHQSLCQTTITPIHHSVFSCQLCSASFTDQLSFFEHLKAHYEPIVEVQEGPSPMPKMDAKIDEPHDEQKDSLLSSLLNNIHCVQCNKTFRRQKTYEAHVREVHNKVDLNEFSEPEDLMAGIDVVVDANVQNSDDDSKSWLCRYRDEELHATEADLREFEAQDHVCHICKQPFPIRAILLQHLVTCRASAENAERLENTVSKKKSKKKVEFSCTECDRVFTHRNSLIYHMRSHTGNRPHQCDQCGKSFFAASALKVHLRLHTGDKPYRCDKCGRNFRQWGDLKYHCISIHTDEKEYQCEFCGKDFARKYSLIVHRRIHTGEKNYKCEFCQKTFRASSYLQNHRRIHTGEKPHICEICGKPFRVRSDMKRHLKTHGRRRMLTSSKPSAIQTFSENESAELIVAKIEEDISEGASENSSGPRITKIEPESERAVSSLQFDQDPLDTVRDNTLYTNGHQLFICYNGELPVRNVESTSTWIQTD